MKVTGLAVELCGVQRGCCSLELLRWEGGWFCCFVVSSLVWLVGWVVSHLIGPLVGWLILFFLWLVHWFVWLGGQSFDRSIGWLVDFVLFVVSSLVWLVGWSVS